MFKGSIAEAIARFELIRRLLGHHAGLTNVELAQLATLPFGEVLLTYSQLETEAFEAARHKCNNLRCPSYHCSRWYEDPVRPLVNVVDGTISHVTSGGTVLTVRVFNEVATLQMRRQTSLNRNDPKRAAIALLSGYLSSPQWLEWQEGVPSLPLRAGEQLLSLMLGDRAAEAIVGNYYPDWSAWAAEIKARKSFERRLAKSAARRVVNTPLATGRPEPGFVSPDEPLAEWEQELQ